MTRLTLLLVTLGLAACVAIGCAGDGVTPVTQSAFIRIVSPNGGEKWIPGTDHEIIWVSEHIDGTVIIEYSRDNFATDVNGIATDEPNDGSFLWEDIPDSDSDTLRVKITWTDFPIVSDISDGDFSIGHNGWAQTWGGTNDDWGWAVATDGSGNVYVAGTFHNVVYFDPDDGAPHTTNGDSDVNLTRYDSFGNLEWVRAWGGSGVDYGYGVVADIFGSVYVTGSFSDTVDFDPGGGDTHASNGGHDVFLSKFDSSGNFEWARTWGGLRDDRGYAIAVDDLGNVYVTGEFRKRVEFDPPGGAPRRSRGLSDVYLSKFDSSGNFEWVRTWGGSETDYSNGIATGGFGGVYVTGGFNGTAYFDPAGGDPRTSNGSFDIFLSKFDSSGNYEWVRTLGGLDYDTGQGVAVDDSGSVYVTGFFSDTMDFDPGGGDLHTSNGGADVFLSRFDSMGDFEWARTWGGVALDPGYGVAACDPGHVYVAGYFGRTVDFNPNGGDAYTSDGYSDVFLSRFDSWGNFEWVRTWGGSHAFSGDCGYGVCADNSGNAYVTGRFRRTADFAPSDAFCTVDPDEHPSNGRDDAFLVKYLPDGCW